MSAMAEVHPEDGISGLQDREIYGHIGLAAGVRLDIDVFGAE
jgi:hypothetical protein